MQHLKKAQTVNCGKGTAWVHTHAHWLVPLGMPNRHIAHASLGEYMDALMITNGFQ